MRRRGADVSLAAPMPDQMPGEAAPQSQRARAGVNIERATEVAGDDLAPFQRIDQMLGKRGPLSQDFALECVLRASYFGLSVLSYVFARWLTVSRFDTN